MNLRDEPTITPDNVRMFEQTVLRADYLFSNSNKVAQSLEKNYGSFAVQRASHCRPAKDRRVWMLSRASSATLATLLSGLTARG